VATTGGGANYFKVSSPEMFAGTALYWLLVPDAIYF